MRNGARTERKREEGSNQGGGEVFPRGFAGRSPGGGLGNGEEETGEEAGRRRRNACRDGGLYRIAIRCGSGHGPRGRREKRPAGNETHEIAARARRSGRPFAAPRAGREFSHRPAADGAADGKQKGLRGGTHAPESTRRGAARQARRRQGAQTGPAERLCRPPGRQWGYFWNCQLPSSSRTSVSLRPEASETKLQLPSASRTSVPLPRAASL